MATINELSLSWVSAMALPEQIFEGRGQPNLSRQNDYFDAFANAGSGAWLTPWANEESYNFFWARNLRRNYRSATAVRAWSRQVPLREASPPQIATDRSGIEVRSDRFIYPTGIGVVLTARLHGRSAPAALLAQVQELATEQWLRLRDDSRPRALSAVMGELLEGAQEKVLASTDPNAVGDFRATSIATATATSGWPTDPPTEADDLHRFLVGLCRQSEAPLTGNVDELGPSLLEPTRSFPGTTRMEVADGRAIWSPTLSTDAAGSHKLECYHRNQILATLQTSVLLRTVEAINDVSITGQADDVQLVLRTVANLLGLVYGQVDDAYASGFARRRIDASGLVDHINVLRQSLSVGGPLH